MPEINQDTEAKIKEAAKRVFVQKGFDGAKVRDIAEAAGVNIALMNYYFRSKEQLFEKIYFEELVNFFGRIVMVLNQPTPFEVKVWQLADKYIDFLLENPQLPTFILAEFQRRDGAIFKKLNVGEVLRQSFFAQQLKQEIELGNFRKIEPLQVIVTLLGNIVFPFVAKPMIQFIGDLDDTSFQAFVQERKQIVPELVMTFLKNK
ncbi:MAG: TetR family transcriptional regulator [Spirosomataceae bacterium]